MHNFQVKESPLGSSSVISRIIKNSKEGKVLEKGMIRGRLSTHKGKHHWGDPAIQKLTK